MQSLIRMIYPPQCVMCDAKTESDFALCGSCWGETPFIDGMCCDRCGVPLPGGGEPDPEVVCDDCMRIERPWSKGRSTLMYKDRARRLVLSLKHGDRTDLARAVGPWMARAAQGVLTEDTVLVPIPLHRIRLLRRKYNQAGLLADQVGKVTGHPVVPDALIRPQATKPLEGHTKDQRFAALDGQILPHPKQAAVLVGHTVVLVDDVMTSGATLAAATHASFQAGAKDVRILTLARVVKDA